MTTESSSKNKRGGPVSPEQVAKRLAVSPAVEAVREVFVPAVESPEMPTMGIRPHIVLSLGKEGSVLVQSDLPISVQTGDDVHEVNAKEGLQVKFGLFQITDAAKVHMNAALELLQKLKESGAI